MAPETAGSIINGKRSADGSVSRQNSVSSAPDQEARRLVLPEPVGITNLPNQHVNRAIKQGFVFNLMIVGGTGLGKSTLADSLFNQKFSDISSKTHNIQIVELQKQSNEFVEKSVRLRLSIIETKGFGDQIDKTKTHDPIVSYLDHQFENHLQKELEVKRVPSFDIEKEDSRVHCCIYMFSPNGPGIRAMDLITLRELDSRVNIIPVIARADSLTVQELKKLKMRIMSELVDNGIHIYTFPTDDGAVSEKNNEFNNLLPFAVIGSRDFVKVGSKNLRARQYPWGTVQVDRDGHCDFAKMRDAIIKYNLEDLRESTHVTHYGRYRMRRLGQMGFGSSGGDLGPVVGSIGSIPGKTASFLETFEARRQANAEEMKRKEDEVRAAFVTRVKEKEAELKRADQELNARFESLRKQLAHDRQALEQEAIALKQEMNDLELRKQTLYGAGHGHGATIHSSSTSLASSLKLKYKR